VDEAQNCGPEELFILRLLRRFRVSPTAVADLDQSIFEFRRAEPAQVLTFMDELPKRLLLSGNFRSSPAICALNNSPRSGSHVESAAGENAQCPLAVQLLEFSSLDTSRVGRAARLPPR
jgi:DNA helicase-2/ATP-dependent DNA helicase PcrA